MQLLSTNHITDTLPTESSAGYGPLYYVAGLDSSSGSHIFKAAVYNSTARVPISLVFDTVRTETRASLTVLTAPDPYAYNRPATNVVKSVTSTITSGPDGVFSFSLPNLSVAVLKTE
jgi:alpha-L-arabinofuranosidase